MAGNWQELRPGSKVVEFDLCLGEKLMQTYSKPLLKAKQKPKANRRSVKLPSKRFVSVYGGFPSR